MDFRLDDEQLALADAVRSLCARHFDLTAVADREARPASDAAWSDLAAMGIFGLLGVAPGEPGSAVAAVVAIEALAAHLATGPTLWTTLGAPLVPGAADGDVRVTGLEAPRAAPAVVTHAEESAVLLVVHADRVERCDTGTLRLETGEPLDPLTPAAIAADLPRGDVVGDADAARGLVLRGTVLAAASLVGLAQGALDVARGYALERHQFGVPIGSFQAIKHLLADMYGRVELARAAAYAAAAILDDPRAGEPATAAATAKLLAGEAGIANGRAAVQILGGMGFTWEMLPHYFLKRAWVHESEFGTGAEHALALGDALGAPVGAG